MRKFLLFVFLITSYFISLSQTNNKDSLWLVYNNKSNADTARLEAISVIAKVNAYNDPDTALILANQALALAKQTGQIKYQARLLNTISSALIIKNSYAEALKINFAALKKYEEINDKNGIALSYKLMGSVYLVQKNYAEALKMLFASIKLYEEAKNKDGLASCYNNIGNLYYTKGDYTEATKYYTSVLKIDTSLNFQIKNTNSYFNLGFVYEKLHDYATALKYYNDVVVICKKMNSNRSLPAAYGNMANTYYYMGNYAEALKYLFLAMPLDKEFGRKHGLADNYMNLGRVYTKLNNAKEAQLYLDKALALSLEIGIKELIIETYLNFIVLDSTTNNYKAAFEHHKLYTKIKASLIDEEATKKGLQATMQYEFDKKEMAAKAAQDKIDTIHAEENQKQLVVIYAVAGVLVLVLVFALFMFNRFRITNRQKIIIENQKQRVDKAYDMLHEKNKEVMDSIRYAKRIQNALLPAEKYIENTFNKLRNKN